jgi:hypothetical protein
MGRWVRLGCSITYALVGPLIVLSEKGLTISRSRKGVNPPMQSPDNRSTSQSGYTHDGKRLQTLQVINGSRHCGKDRREVSDSHAAKLLGVTAHAANKRIATVVRHGATRDTEGAALKTAHTYGVGSIVSGFTAELKDLTAQARTVQVEAAHAILAGRTSVAAKGTEHAGSVPNIVFDAGASNVIDAVAVAASGASDAALSVQGEVLSLCMPNVPDSRALLCKDPASTVNGMTRSEALLHSRFAIDAAERDHWNSVAASLAPASTELDCGHSPTARFFVLGLAPCASCDAYVGKLYVPRREAAARADAERIAIDAVERDRERQGARDHVAAQQVADMLKWFSVDVPSTQFASVPDAAP